jgi:hypothetical protein
MKVLIESVRDKNPHARIAISAILPRLKDEHNPQIEINRRKANSKIRKMGKKQGAYFLESWKAVEVKKEEETTDKLTSPSTAAQARDIGHTSETVDKNNDTTEKKLSKKGFPQEEKNEPEIDRTCFGDDLLHLSDKGINAMYEFLKGNVANLISKKSLWTNKAGKKTGKKDPSKGSKDSKPI